MIELSVSFHSKIFTVTSEFAHKYFHLPGPAAHLKKNMAFNNQFSPLNNFGSQMLNDLDVWPSVEDDPDVWSSPVPAGHK